MKKLKPNVRPMAWKFLLWAVVLFLLVDALAKFGITDLTGTVNPVFLPIVLGLFILLDVGIWQKKGKGLDVADWFSVSIAGVVLLSVAVDLLGFSVGQLTTIQGVADLFLGVFVVVNIFKK